MAVELQIAADAIARMPCPSQQDFLREIRPANRPVIFEGALDHWPALGRWGFDDFRQRFGDTEVLVEVGELLAEGRVTHDGKLVDADRVRVPLSRYLDAAENPAPGEMVYLAEWSAFQDCPELWDDLDLGRPDLYHQAFAAPLKLFVGPRGAYTPLHFDYAPNFTAQITGQKRWIFCAPTETPNLYPYPWRSDVPHFSRMGGRLDGVVEGDFPRASGVRFMECTLGPGELLYVPEYWWHHVAGLEPNISLHYFWKPWAMVLLQYLRKPLDRITGHSRGSDARYQPGRRPR